MAYLDLERIEDKHALGPITATPRNRLQVLHLSGTFAAYLPDPLPLVRPGSLPALRDLTLDRPGFEDWSFLRHVHTALRSLALVECFITADGIADIGAAVARLPALEELRVRFVFDGPEIGAVAAMETLLSGPPLRCLRVLQTGMGLKDNDASLGRLIELADKVPQLR